VCVALQRVFRQLDSTGRGKLGPDDLALAFERLSYEPPAVTDFGNSEIEDMIWEVDEDADGFIDWTNFVLLYGRARTDKVSREPRRLFNLIDFMTCDKDGGGNIDEDECLEILYRRYGKRLLSLCITLSCVCVCDRVYNLFVMCMRM
jgi:calmodulin